MLNHNHFDSSWPVVLIFGILAAFVLGVTPSGQQLFAALLESAPFSEHAGIPICLPRPEVLVVTRNGHDRFVVAATVNPRGYRVRVAETAATSQAVLRSEASRIGVIVVDSELPYAHRVVALARALAPLAKVVELHPHHSAEEISSLLLQAI